MSVTIGAAVFAKLVSVILGMGVIGGGLLALRQQRLEAASDLARAQVRIRAQDERLWKLRAMIAERTGPERVREMAVALGPLRPIVPALPSSAAEIRRASAEQNGPVIVDAPALPRGARPLSPPPGSSAAGARYAKVETRR